MAEEKKLTSFEVESGIVPIKIIARHVGTGEEHTLIHHVREPETSEWKEYNRRDSGTEIKRNKLIFEPKTLAAAEWLYDEIAQKVEGYTKNGVDIMTLENWQSLVPIMHKPTVIRKFSEVWGEDKEETKNS